MGQKADRAQQPRGVVDQMEKRSKRENAEHHRQHHQLVDFLCEVLGAEREHQCKYEEPDGVFDDAIAQQRRCDQSRGQLCAGNLNGYRQGAEGEYNEESYGCEGFEQCPRAVCVKPSSIQAMHRAGAKIGLVPARAELPRTEPARATI